MPLNTPELTPSLLPAPPPVLSPAIAWTRQFGYIIGDVAYSVVVDRLGNVYVAGGSSHALDWHSFLREEVFGVDGAFLRKYDSSGNEIWTITFGASFLIIPTSVAVDSSGGVYVAGVTGGTLLSQSSSGGWDAFLRKYDSSGRELWTLQFGSSQIDQARSVAVDSSGNVYVAGYTGGILPGQSSSGGTDAFIRKFTQQQQVAAPTTAAIGVPLLIYPVSGAVMDNGRTDRQDDIIWEFRWDEVDKASGYHLYVTGSNTHYPLSVDVNITGTSYRYVFSGGYIDDQNLSGWKWKVKAKV